MSQHTNAPEQRPSLPPGPIVSLRYRVPPDRRGALFEFLAGAIRLYESPGGIAVGLYESLAERASFLELVAYASEEAFVSDQKRVEEHPEWKKALAQWREIVAGPIEVALLSRVEIAPPAPTEDARGPRADRTGPLRLVVASEEAISRVWSVRWGAPVVTVSGSYRPCDVEGIALVGSSETPAGLVTWTVRGGEAEIVTVDTLEEGRGEGPRLLCEAERRMREQGAIVARLVTSNDNVRAAGFYQSCGYRLTRLHLDALDAVRRVKAGVPETGLGGVPLRDLWEFEKRL
jgi:GNAT superfamily N-acetyltransferase